MGLYGKWLKGNAFGKVSQGERASPEGVVRRTKFGSAAKYVFCGFAADYKIRAAIQFEAAHLPLARRAFPLSHLAVRRYPSATLTITKLMPV